MAQRGMKSAIITLLILMSLSRPSHAGGSAPGTITCSPPPQAQEILKRETRYLIFGEMHGTVESPRTFGEMVCAALRSGMPVVVALEFPVSSSTAFEKYVSSSGARGDVEDLLRNTHWDSPIQDGRTSMAMFELFERLRLLREAGLVFRIVGFVPQPTGRPTQEAHERGMSDQLQEFSKLYGDSRLFVLVGNLHARKQTIGSSGQSLNPMAALLPATEVTNVHLLADGGAAGHA